MKVSKGQSQALPTLRLISLPAYSFAAALTRKKHTHDAAPPHCVNIKRTEGALERRAMGNKGQDVTRNTLK